MEIFSSQPLLIATATCLFPFFIASIIIAVRTRNLAAGFRFFSIFALFFGISFVVGYFFDALVPSQSQTILYRVLIICSWLMIIVLFGLYQIFSREGGKLAHKDSRRIENSTAMIVSVVFLLLLTSPVRSSDNSEASVFFVLLLLMVELRFYFTIFEIREHGFFANGRIILFSNIEHAEWNNLRDKTSIKIRLMNNKKVITIKTPWDLITPIDNYIRTNFPHP